MLMQTDGNANILSRGTKYKGHERLLYAQIMEVNSFLGLLLLIFSSTALGKPFK